MKVCATLILVALSSFMGSPAVAAAHSHGTGELSVAVEDGLVDILLTAPLADLVGRERAPETATERAEVLRRRDALIAAPLFSFEGAACTRDATSFVLPQPFLTATDVDPVLESSGGDSDALKADAHPEEHDEDHDQAHHDRGDGTPGGEVHEDGLVSWRYRCDGNPVAVEVNFEPLAPLVQLHTQTLTDAGPRALDLRPDARRVPLR
ncbi:MAG: DUF2796 domain-containing protein [Pseudomonadales bacterium]|jgi:hypothetical protein|nr:DUF2796 domain-containing protein [Pseudomonadales bacterium]